MPSLELGEERDLEFDWDREIPLSERARRALEFVRKAMEQYISGGQPIWPVVPSSLYGAFLAEEDPDLNLLMITFDASVDGWAALLQRRPLGPAR